MKNSCIHTYIYIYMNYLYCTQPEYRFICRLFGDVPHMLWQTSEVLKVLEDKRTVMNAPTPFPQSAQYKKEDEGGPEEADLETGKPRKKKTMKSKKAKKRGPAQVDKTKVVEIPKDPAPSEFMPATSMEIYTPSRYSELRKHFVNEKMSDGLSWRNAQDEWNKCDLKRQLLCAVPLPELKRRRFVSKDCTANPWAA